MKKTLLLIYCLVTFLGMAQANRRERYWATDSAWFQSKDTIREDRIDLLYLVSTNVLSATQPNGQKAYHAQLTTEDRKALSLEMAYVEQHMAKGDFNYLSPYYHQFTFDALQLPQSKFKAEYKKVRNEVCQSFDYYMQHLNHGRPFALVGFSQGAMLVLDLLKHMTDAQYNQMVAAYALGYRLAAEDVKCKHIVPATNERTRGVTISFNTALNDSAIWPIVAGDAVAAINPVNWKTDSTAATFIYEGHPHKVHLSPTTRLLVVETPQADIYRQWNANPVFRSAHVPLDCLHHWDLLFYPQFIHDNLLQRAQ